MYTFVHLYKFLYVNYMCDIMYQHVQHAPRHVHVQHVLVVQITDHIVIIDTISMGIVAIYAYNITQSILIVHLISNCKINRGLP